MSRIDSLIAQLAPQGVEFKVLGDIAELVRGNGMPKAALKDEGVGAIHYGQIYTRYGAWATNTISYVALATAAKLTKVNPGDIIITNTSENIEDVGKAVAWLGAEPIVTGGHATVIRHHQLPKFLSYWFQSEEFSVQKKALANGTKVIDVSAKQLAKVRIPVPPIEIQREIVRILDDVTELKSELEAKLEAELEARKIQHTYCRDKLLTFNDTRGVQRVPLGELGEFIRGRRFTKDDYVDVGIPCIHYGEIYTHYRVAATTALSHIRNELASQLRFAEPGDIVIAAVGETVEDVAKAVAWMGNEPVAIHDDTFLFRSDLDPKYVAYVMQTTAFHVQKSMYVARAKVKRLSGESLGRIVIPVPSIEEQQRIVRILDKFEVLVNDLSDGLTAELNARRKEYGYYRDKLLTFREAAA
jgi:type I restriction enzyme S subunit